jgi:hypothetical protein
MDEPSSSRPGRRRAHVGKSSVNARSSGPFAHRSCRACTAAGWTTPGALSCSKTSRLGVGVDRRLDLAYALLSIRASGATPQAADFDDEAAYAALLAGSNAYNAAQPVDDSIMRASVLREGWLHDLQYALVWVADLLGLPQPEEIV